jgi:hypothetical protein
MDSFENLFFVFLNSPCYETPKKRVKNIDEKKKKKKNRESNCFVLALQQIHVTFVFFFSTPPCREERGFVKTEQPQTTDPLPAQLLTPNAQRPEHGGG